MCKTIFLGDWAHLPSQYKSFALSLLKDIDCLSLNGIH